MQLNNVACYRDIDRGCHVMHILSWHLHSIHKGACVTLSNSTFSIDHIHDFNIVLHYQICNETSIRNSN